MGKISKITAIISILLTIIIFVETPVSALGPVIDNITGSENLAVEDEYEDFADETSDLIMGEITENLSKMQMVIKL